MKVCKTGLTGWFFLLCALFVCGWKEAVAQRSQLPAYQPTRAEMAERYRQAVLLDSMARGAALRLTLNPNWQKDGNGFWYRNYGKDSLPVYMFVDATNGSKRPAFDAERLAAALDKATGKPVKAKNLAINAMNFEGNNIKFRWGGQVWQCDLATYNCTPVNAGDTAALFPRRNATAFTPYSRWSRHYVRGDSMSKDEQWIAYIKDYNVWMRPVNGSGGEVQFTTDGTIQKPYGALIWSPDSKYFVGYKIDRREDKEVYLVLSAVPGTTRGQLRSRGYAQPGDEFTSYEMYTFDIGTKKAIKTSTEKYDFLGMPVPIWNGPDKRYFMYEKADRGHQRFRVIEVDALTGNTKNIVDEKTNTFIYEQRIFTHYLPGTNEIVWVTEKDGWRHAYLVDVARASVKPITQGEWVLRFIDSVDTKKRQIWFTASGMNKDEDPYNVHYYRINFDGKGLVSLTPAKGNHNVAFSPDRKYFTDTYSQPSVPPVTELRTTADGKLVAELERADISGYLALGIRMPEVFTAKGRDGKTDIWGIVCRPRNFDSTKRYPVIENIYAGPQDSFVPKDFRQFSEMQSIAELGFIVVQCDGMGTANRSKAFHDVCWKNIADAGFPDRIAWMKALAARYPYVDVDKVGIYGTSAGGQNSMGALLFHPEFYKVAVSAAGCHDNRIDKQWWNEQWMGYPVGKHYDEQSNITNASKLQGDVLLIVGEADTNVPPESTYRLADALIKSDKMFDFLMIPGADHTSGGNYGMKKRKDFFVKHLLDVDPPVRNPTRSSPVPPGRLGE
ncbi:MAG: prolyl oligopeptidase family serine peptidase [Williamsia sp.]|nr:prolyl oligopeptidase family serine peptidase [Williamsia sp.]